MDLFTREDAKIILANKNVLLIGDSILRSIYQDTLSLLEVKDVATEEDLAQKGEELETYMGDVLDPSTGTLTTGRDYTEIRRYRNDNIQITFLFTTRITRGSIQEYLETVKDKAEPDIILVLSALWDVSRWSSTGPRLYEENCNKFLHMISDYFEDVFLIWLLTPPVSPDITGAILVENMQEELSKPIRFFVLEANTAAARVVAQHGYDVVDLHYHMLTQIHKRMDDGIHWTGPAVRFQTNLILAHIAESENVELPSRWAGTTNHALQHLVSVSRY